MPALAQDDGSAAKQAAADPSAADRAAELAKKLSNPVANLITRTIVPILDQSGFPLEAINKSGLGDTVASQFFSPKSATAGGLI